MSLCFGEFELDPERRLLLRAGVPVPLEPKAYELLSLLLERRPRALSRAQIRDVIWPGTHVSESTLAVVVTGIRQALGDDARRPRFIRTVHRFGYAFCGEARSMAGPCPDAAVAAREAGAEDTGDNPAEGAHDDATHCRVVAGRRSSRAGRGSSPRLPPLPCCRQAGSCPAPVGPRRPRSRRGSCPSPACRAQSSIPRSRPTGAASPSSGTVPTATTSTCT